MLLNYSVQMLLCVTRTSLVPAALYKNSGNDALQSWAILCLAVGHPNLHDIIQETPFFFARYFGAAKDLPGVRELFETEIIPDAPRKTRPLLADRTRI